MCSSGVWRDKRERGSWAGKGQFGSWRQDKRKGVIEGTLYGDVRLEEGGTAHANVFDKQRMAAAHVYTNGSPRRPRYLLPHLSLGDTGMSMRSTMSPASSLLHVCPCARKTTRTFRPNSLPLRSLRCPGVQNFHMQICTRCRCP